MKLARLAVAITILLLLFLFRSCWMLPKLPPQEVRGSCTICHWDKKDIPAHQEQDFNEAACLQCHNPHTHFGKPYLPAIDSCLTCHFELKPKPGHYIHKPTRLNQCTSCHRPHKLFERPSLVTDKDKLCFVCHRDETIGLDSPVSHMPYGKGQCLSCHDAHMAPNRKLMRQSLTMLCQSCHRMDDEWQREVQHMPFERGHCMDCHTGHVSQWRGLLKKDQTTLCYSCHYDRKEELKRPLKHGPYGDGKCTDCHEPHSSAGKNLLPYKEMEKFCLSCHTNIKALGWDGSPHQILFDSKSCLACHEHHSSFYKYLSRFPLDGKGNLCFTCHPHIAEHYYRTAHRVLRCGQCHQIHGSLYLYLLESYELDLCNRCHPGLKHRTTNHPVGGQYWDILRNRQMLCSGCHGPHGTQYPKMELRHGNDLCIPCHEVIK